MKKIEWKTVERIIYILIILGLVVFGLIKDSEVAARLIQSVKEAFTILL